MAQALASQHAIRPTDALVQSAQVVRVARVSPGFIRVTIGGPLDFRPQGRDQWLRLFFPRQGQGSGLTLPWGTSEGWYSRLLAMQEDQRPLVRNYTIRQANRTDDGWELDIDFVLHEGPSGQVEGVAAGWALQAKPGDCLGILDQGALLTADLESVGHLHLFADDTGVPGVEAIVRDLPAGMSASATLEVGDAADFRDLPSAADVEVRWLVREDHTMLPGTLVRDTLWDRAIAPGDHVHAVGEASLALAARKRARSAGLRDEQIDFCAYWRPA